MYFFHGKICFKSEERVVEKGGFNAFSSKLFFQKNWLQDHIYTLEFLKIVFLLWAVLTYNFRQSV